MKNLLGQEYVYMLTFYFNMLKLCFVYGIYFLFKNLLFYYINI